MPEDRMGQVGRENAEVLHFLETPFRWLMNAIKAVFMIVVLVMLVLANQVGWLVNVGSRSQRARDARQNRLESQIDPSPGSQWSVFDVDFRTQPNPKDHLDRENRFWDDNRPLYMAQREDDVNWKTKAFTTNWIFGWGGNPGEGIPYCTVLMHLNRLADFYNATPGSWETRTLGPREPSPPLDEVNSLAKIDNQHPASLSYCARTAQPTEAQTSSIPP